MKTNGVVKFTGKYNIQYNMSDCQPHKYRLE